MKDFDPVRAAFFLIAFVIGIHALVIVAGVGACLMYAHEIITNVNIECDPKGRLMELLAVALAAAVAFAGLSKR